MNHTTKFAVLAYVGFTTYITVEVCFRGYSYPLMGVCGSILLLLLDYFIERIPWSVDLFTQGLIGSGLITCMELIIGITLQACHFPAMWDYSSEWMNFRGVICPLFSFLWIAVSCLGIMLADSINYYLLCCGSRPHYTLFRKISFIFPERKILYQ